MDETHIVQIPLTDQENKQNQEDSATTTTTMSLTIQHHPLAEISDSPGHLLLLKLWQREDDLFARRISLKETRIDTLRREVSHLCTAFLFFHGLFLTLIFTSSVDSNNQFYHHCDKGGWWVPSFLSLVTSAVILALVQLKLCRYWKVWRQLQREKSDNRALGRCVQELRMKGASYDLSKEPVQAKKMKSSSVEINWGPVSLCRRYLAAICLLCFTGLVFPAPKLILCVF